MIGLAHPAHLLFFGTMRVDNFDPRMPAKNGAAHGTATLAADAAYIWGSFGCACRDR